MALSERILLISTQAPALQQMIEASPTRLAGSVEVLTDPAQLLAWLAAQTYRLLLVDLELLGGKSFWDDLKAVAPQMGVIILAIAEQRRQAAEQLSHGAADYVLLPVEPPELWLKINRLLEIQAFDASTQTHPLDSATDELLLLLHQAAQEISQTWSVGEALKVVLAKAQQLTHADSAIIYQTDHGSNLNRTETLSIPRHTRVGADKVDEVDLLFSLAEQAALTQEIVHCQKATEPMWPDQAPQAVLCLPLISRDRLIGVLTLGHYDLPGFADSHVHWLSVFCDQAAIAIENARLFENLASAYIDLAQSREQILHSRNTLQVLFDGIADGLCILDQDLTIKALNQVEAARQGYRPEELVGKSCLSLDWAKAAPELLERIKESLETGRETTWISSENETEPYLKDREFRIYPIRNRIAQIEQVVIFGQDVSERRRWQASLFRSANLAAVGQLAGSVAHQINNPLTITMANSQLLLREIDPNTEAYELASGTLKAGERIQKIVENLLGFSNQETYFFVEADLIETIEGALALVARPLQKDRVELIKNYEARPKLSASVSHLKLVWMNLLLNARDASVGFTDHPQITISTQAASEREVKVVIMDNGVGIAEKDFERLFRPFFTTKPVGKALGLGLYSAHAIIERHQGQINVFSQPGVVTTFEVILPLDNPRTI
jgi:two-component system NtrC family sensor kinase